MNMKVPRFQKKAGSFFRASARERTKKKNKKAPCVRHLYLDLAVLTFRVRNMVLPIFQLVCEMVLCWKFFRFVQALFIDKRRNVAAVLYMNSI